MGTKMQCSRITNYRRLRAFKRYFSHQFRIMRTVARPSSLFSVPSGLPMMRAKSQKTAAIQEKKATPRLSIGEMTWTRMRAVGLNSKV